MKHYNKFILAFLFIFFSPLSMINILAGSMIPITLVLDWTPNTNHTGFIVANKLGFYKNEGLEIKILQPGKGTAEVIVSRNLANFGISSESNLLEAYIKGIPLISIATIIAHNTSGFYSLKEKNILTPKDFEGKVYGSWGSKLEIETIKAMMEAFGADFNKVKIITIGNIDFFKTKDIDFVWGFEAWTGIFAKINRIPVNYISIKNTINLDGHTPLIITNKNMLDNHKDIIQKFMRATSKGFNYAISHPIKAGKILLEEYPELNKDFVLASQKYISSKYKDKNHPWSYQNPKVWSDYVKWNYNNKIIDKLFNAKLIYTNEFIN